MQRWIAGVRCNLRAHNAQINNDAYRLLAISNVYDIEQQLVQIIFKRFKLCRKAILMDVRRFASPRFVQSEAGGMACCDASPSGRRIANAVQRRFGGASEALRRRCGGASDARRHGARQTAPPPTSPTLAVDVPPNSLTIGDANQVTPVLIVTIS